MKVLQDDTDNTPDSDEVRFYFNYLTGKVDHTGNIFFKLTKGWKFIGVFKPDVLPKTPFKVTIIEEEMKWVIRRWGKVISEYSMTKPEIAAYQDYIVKQVTKSLTK